jgi:hypothetical protein
MGVRVAFSVSNGRIQCGDSSSGSLAKSRTGKFWVFAVTPILREGRLQVVRR